MVRKAQVQRQTRETNVKLELNIDGRGQAVVETGIGFFNHLLDAMARHGLFDLTLEASGDVDVDYHHLVEDTGLVLGQAFASALGNKAGIRRFGSSLMPMDESLIQAAVDISGRAYLGFDAPFNGLHVGGFNLQLVEEFFRAFVQEAKVTLHLLVLKGVNGHHMAEAMFKAVGRALDEATMLDERVEGIPSAKGTL